MGYLSKVTDMLGVSGPSRGDVRVLVVDDEEIVAEMYSDWLDEEGFDVEVANSGIEALRTVDDSFDVLLLDRRMPRLTGDDVLDVITSEDIQNMNPERFKGEPYRSATEDDWDKDIRLQTVKRLDKDLVGKIQESEIEARTCMVTAVDPDVDIVHMRFDHYLTKEIDRDELVEVVEELAALSKAGAEQVEYQSMQWKKRVLKGSKTESELRESDYYQQLQDRIEEMEGSEDEGIERVKQVNRSE